MSLTGCCWSASIYSATRSVLFRSTLGFQTEVSWGSEDSVEQTSDVLNLKPPIGCSTSQKQQSVDCTFCRAFHVHNTLPFKELWMERIRKVKYDGCDNISQSSSNNFSDQRCVGLYIINYITQFGEFFNIFYFKLH